jgi:type II secretory pathway pseudopilin PulG
LIAPPPNSQFAIRVSQCASANNQSPISDNPLRDRVPNNRELITDHRNSTAFTLIELLVVISIIIILMGLLFPAFQGVQNQAKRTQAKNDVAQIVTAVTAYYTEYGVYPLNSQNNGGTSDTVYGDPGGTFSSADLFNVLRAIPDGNYNANNQLNSKSVVFFTGQEAKDQKNPRGGFYSGSSAVTNANGYSVKPGSYVDPWGDEYAVFIDADYNGEVTQALGWFYGSEYGGGTTHVRVGVASASLGKDGKWGDNSNGRASGTDDVLSWQ